MVPLLFDTIPDEWRVVRIRDIFSLYKGTTPSTKVPEYWNGDIPFVTPTDITTLKRSNQIFLERTSKYLTEKGLRSKRLKLVPRNSLLVTTRATIGECTINKIEVTINQGIVALIPKDHNKIDILFYYYLIQVMKPYLESLAGGSTYKEISLKRLSEIQIPIPPLDEQRKIARILYTVDEAIAKTDAIISRVEELRRALLNYLMTHGIGHREYKETEIGKIPKEWRVIKLKDIAVKVLGGGTPSTKNPRYWDGNIPWMTSVGIPEDDIYITKGERFITEEGLKNSATKVIPKGNLIIATRVGLGKAGVNLIDIAINQDLTGLIINKNMVAPEYLAWYVKSSSALSYILAHARGTTIKGISRRVLLDLKVPIPPLEEQKKIVDLLNSLTILLKNEKNRKEKLELIKRTLMNFLLTGKVRVKDLPID